MKTTGMVKAVRHGLVALALLGAAGPAQAGVLSRLFSPRPAARVASPEAIRAAELRQKLSSKHEEKQRMVNFVRYNENNRVLVGERNRYALPESVRLSAKLPMSDLVVEKRGSALHVRGGGRALFGKVPDSYSVLNASQRQIVGRQLAADGHARVTFETHDREKAVERLGSPAQKAALVESRRAATNAGRGF